MTSIKRSAMSGMIWRFGERICAQLVSFAVSLVLARLLIPEDYGVVALLTIFIDIANVFVVNGFGTALVQKKNADNIDFSTVFYFNGIFSIILYILFYLIAPMISEFYGNITLTWYLRILALKIPLAGVNSIQQAYVQRKMLFKKFFYATLIGTIFSAFVGITMAYKGLGAWALVCQYLVNSLMDTIILWNTVKWRPQKVFDCKRLKKLFDFGWKILGSSLLHTIYTNLRSVVIGKSYSSADLGYYNQGERLPRIFVTNINTTINSVMFPVMATAQDDKERLKKMVRISIRTSSLFMWPLMVGMIVLADKIVTLLFTEKWLPCVPFMKIACIQCALEPIQTVNLESIKAIGRSDVYLKMEIIKKGYGIVILILTMRYGVMAIALGALSQTVVASLVNSSPNRKLLQYNYKEQMEDLFPSIIIATFMGISVYQIDNILPFGLIFSTIVQIMFGAVIYILLTYIFRKDDFYMITNLFLSLLKDKKKNI